MKHRRRFWALFACLSLLACRHDDDEDGPPPPLRRRSPAADHDLARPAHGAAGPGGQGGGAQAGSGGSSQAGQGGGLDGLFDEQSCHDASLRLEKDYELRSDHDCDALLRFDNGWHLGDFSLHCQSSPHGIDASQARALAEAAGLPTQAVVLESKGVFIGLRPPSDDTGRLIAVSMASSQVILDASLGDGSTVLAPTSWLEAWPGLDSCSTDPGAPTLRGISLDTGSSLDDATLAQAQEATTSTALYKQMAAARTWGGLSGLVLEGSGHGERLVLLWLRACWGCGVK